MTLIDDEGNLFGVVNVIDALVVLFVLAVVVAGLAVAGVLGTDERIGNITGTTESDSQYATISLDSQPHYVVDRITVGDSTTHNGATLTVTDVYSTATNATSSAVLLRVEVSDHERLRTGETVGFATDEYSTEGSILEISESNSSLRIEPTTVELKIEALDADVVSAIEVGANQTRTDESLPTVQTVTTQPTDVLVEGADGYVYLREHPTRHDVRLTVELGTIRTESGPQFHGSPLRVGNTITLDLKPTTIDGTVVNVGE